MTEETKKILCGNSNEVNQMTSLGTISLMKKEHAEDKLSYKVKVSGYNEEKYQEGIEIDPFEMVLLTVKEVDKAVKYAYGVTMVDVVMSMQEQNIDSDKVFNEQDTFYADVLICTEKEEYAIYSKQLLYFPMDD